MWLGFAVGLFIHISRDHALINRFCTSMSPVIKSIILVSTFNISTNGGLIQLCFYLSGSCRLLLGIKHLSQVPKLWSELQSSISAFNCLIQLCLGYNAFVDLSHHNCNAHVFAKCILSWTKNYLFIANPVNGKMSNVRAELVITTIRGHGNI